MLEYQIDKTVDLRDHAPPAGRKRRARFSRGAPNPAGFAWGVDYAVFNSTFARATVRRPAHPGQFLTLCQLSDRGLVQRCLMRVRIRRRRRQRGRDLEWAHDLTIRIAQDRHNWNQCAATAASSNAFPHCGGSLRIGFINASPRRQVASFMARSRHGAQAERRRVDSFGAPYFKEFADFDPTLKPLGPPGTASHTATRW